MALRCIPIFGRHLRISMRKAPQSMYYTTVSTLSKMPSSASCYKPTSLRRYCDKARNVLWLSDGHSQQCTVDSLKQKDDVLCAIIEQLYEDHAIDVCVVETSEERRKYADYVIVVSGASTRHLKAMTNHLYEQCKKEFHNYGVTSSGRESDDWMIVDLNTIVVHLFLPESRAKYELEKLWWLGAEKDEQYKTMLKDDEFSEMVKNAKLQDFYVKDQPK